MSEINIIIPPFGSSLIDGLTLSNNVTDPTNDVDAAPGFATLYDGTYWRPFQLVSTLTKRLDANWAVGTGNGGLDTGSKANSTWYHYHLISNGDIVDALYSLSATSPTMPSGYTYARLSMSIYVDSGGTIKPFTQNGDEVLWSTVELHARATNPGTSAVLRTVLTPLGVKCGALLYATLSGNSVTNTSVYFSSPDVTDEAVGVGRTTMQYGSALSNRFSAALPPIRTNTSSQVRTRVGTSTADVDLDYGTAGFIHPRGRTGIAGNGGGGTGFSLAIQPAQTASFTAVKNCLYPVDMSGAGADFTVTAPASPSHGDMFGYYLARSNATYECLFGRNSSNVFGGTDADPYLLYIAGEVLIWQYDATTSGRGWFLATDGRIAGQCKIYRNTAQSISRSTFTQIQHGTTEIDNGGMANLASFRIDIRRKGNYELSHRYGFDFGAAENTLILSTATKNGTTSTQRLSQAVSNAASHADTTLNVPHATITETVALARADYIAHLAFWVDNDNNASAKNTLTNVYDRTFISATEVLA